MRSPPVVLSAEDNFRTQTRPRRSGLALTRPPALEAFRRPDPCEDVWIVPRDPDSVSDPSEGIRMAPGCSRLDAGVTLALIVGAQRRVEHLAVALDVVRRDVPAGQAYLARSYPTHTPISEPTAAVDDAPDLSNLRLVLEVDGEVRQDASTRDLVATPDELLASILRRTPLDTGSVILIGSPPGMAFDHDAGWLDVGAEVRAVVDGVGELRTRVVPEDGTPAAIPPSERGGTSPVPRLGDTPSALARAVLVTGTNYRSHTAEMGVATPPAPTANLIKLPVSICGPDSEIPLPSGALIDYEGEIAAVLGRDAYRIRLDHVNEVVAGLCLANDVTARDAPTTHLVLAKGARGFCPLGPALVSLDAVDPAGITFTVSVNGQARQHGTAADMIHSIHELIAEFSHALPLRRGDVILTGSPAGVGVGFDPPMFLQPGDTVTIESPQLGCLSSRFVATGQQGDAAGGQDRL
jgi:2-keto-4-pentenoate hydratase/2-oxohepta-3-ene-1,7-dioic acid hydratase in catechol pathway